MEYQVLSKAAYMKQTFRLLRRNYRKSELHDEGNNRCQNKSERKLVCDLTYTISCIKAGFNKQCYWTWRTVCTVSRWHMSLLLWLFIVDMQWCVKGASTQSLNQAPCAWCGSGTVCVCVLLSSANWITLFTICNDACPAISTNSNNYYYYYHHHHYYLLFVQFSQSYSDSRHFKYVIYIKCNNIIIQ